MIMLDRDMKSMGRSLVSLQEVMTTTLSFIKTYLQIEKGQAEKTKVIH